MMKRANKKKHNRRRGKATLATAAVGLACIGVHRAEAETILTGLTQTNEPVPVDHGSAAPATPNVALQWSDNWDQYDGWPNDPGDGVYQVDQVEHTIQFTPNPGWNVKLLALDLNVWAGGGETEVAWSVNGANSGSLGSGTFITADGTVSNNILDVTGADAESLTLTLTQNSGVGSYLAMDNLAFDQVLVPEPNTLALGLAGMGGLGALAIRRKRK